MNLKPYTPYTWLLPFLFFFSGYYLMNLLCTVTTVETPALVGKKLNEAVTILSGCNLNTRIVTEKTDPDLPDGIIISQNPAAGQKVKTNQSVYLVIIKKPDPKKAPALLGKSKQAINQLLESAGIRAKFYTVPSIYPQNSCIAQHPMVNQVVDEAGLTLYLSSGSDKPVVIPSFKGQAIQKVREFLNSYPVTISTNHSQEVGQGHVCSECMVIDQRPLPGSLLVLSTDRKLAVQLKVEPVLP